MNHATPDKNSQLAAHQQTYDGQRWLVEERDACGVGFIASPAGQPTHKLIEQTLTALTCMEHRGGCSADQDSGDGAGILSAIPWPLFTAWGEEQGLDLSGTLAVGMVFLPQNAEARSVLILSKW
jgi:glutamate synthase (ferredoxin)